MTVIVGISWVFSVRENGFFGLKKWMVSAVKILLL